MNINLTGQGGLEITDAIREYVKEKFSKLERHSHSITQGHIVLSTENKRQTAEITLNIAHAKDLHASATTDDLYASINELADKVERTLRKQKEKGIDASRKAGDKSRLYEEE